jgi:hypothetical protein
MPIRLLILSNLDAASIFRRGSVNRALEWGLGTQPIDWRIHNPASGTPDLSGVDVVLSWCHHIAGDGRAFRQRTVVVEDDCSRAGIPVVNSARTLRRIRHSYCLRRWFFHDIPCALSQNFRTLDEISLRYPLILRVDGGVHSSLDSFLVMDRREAEQVMRSREASSRGRLNLAIEYVETRFPDGFYRKRRCIVVGDRLIPRQHMLSRGWKVKLSSSEANDVSIAEDRAFLAEGEAQGELVARAARVLGCDILALDYSPAPDGSYVFWEANRTFRMAGTGRGVKAEKFREATGRSVEECLAQRNAVGAAIAEWIVRKAQARELAVREH